MLTSTWIGALVFVLVVGGFGLYLAHKEKHR